MITTMATAMVNVGIIIGPWLGGLGIAAGSLTAPMWIGAVLALIGLVTVLPAALESRRKPALTSASDPASAAHHN
jgi:predicted MFS family arabinose efflux permease